MTALSVPAVAAAPAVDWPVGYQLNHTFAELRSELLQFAAAHPDIVSVSSMGKTYEGRKLWLIKISDNVKLDEPEPEVYVQGGSHAYEHAGTEQAMALID